MTVTPLSDSITPLLESNTKALSDEFERLFINSKLGIIITGLPSHASGTQYQVSGTDQVKCQVVSDDQGNYLIKACADPDIFESKFNVGINAIMTGKDIIEMAIKTDVQGILICSAASFHSYALYRNRLVYLWDQINKSENSKNPWWKFW
jgi:hypothetical protein